MLTGTEDSGYIVQFSDKSVLEYKSELEKGIKQREQKLGTSQPLYKYTVGLVESLIISNEKKSIPSRINNQKDRVQKIHDSFKKYIKETGDEKKILGEYENVFNGIALNITRDKAEELEKLKEVKAVYPNRKVHALLMDSVPLIKADQAWNLGYTGKNITIAIIDTGIDYTHPDLGGCFGAGCKVVDGYDFVFKDSDPMDDHGHGTHCAGIAAGNGTLKGVAPDAKLIAYKVLDSTGGGWTVDIISAIERAQDPNQDGNYSDHVDVISMSLGGQGNPDDSLSQAVDTAVENGVVVVVAAGNSGPITGTIGSPGTARKAITVGATYKTNYEAFWLNCTPGEYIGACGVDYCPEEGKVWCDYWGDKNPTVDQITSFSSRGPVIWYGGAIFKPDIVAPGAIICAARYDELFPEGEYPYYYPCLDENHVQLAGTSMSTPIVAGVVGLIKQAHPDWTPDQIKMALRNTAVDLGKNYYIDTQGYGRVDALKAIQLEDPPPVVNLITSGVVRGMIDIKGSIKTDNFDHYILSYTPYEKETLPKTWNQITSSNKLPSDEVLASLDTSTLPDDNYILNLTVYDKKGSKSEDVSLIITRNQFRGWVKDININNFVYVGRIPPLVEDLNGDGLKEVIIVTDQFRKIYVLNHEGFILPGWPVELPPEIERGMSAVPTAVDIDNDGLKEILLYGMYNNMKKVFAYNYDGTLVENFPFEDGSYVMTEGENRDYSSIVVGDLNSDGNKELILTGGCNIQVFNMAGRELLSKNLSSSCYPISTPAIANLDSDNESEIVVALYTHDKEECTPNTTTCTKIHVLNLDGTEVDGWPKEVSTLDGYTRVVLFDSSPSIGDLNGDGKLEIVIGTDTGIFVYDQHGNLLNIIGPQSGFYLFQSPVLGDLDKDGDLEIVVRAFYPVLFMTYAFHHNGSLVEGWPISTTFTEIWDKPPVLADIDGDGEAEVIESSDNIYAWNSDGSYVKGFPIYATNQYGFSSPVISDVNNDGNVEIVITSLDKSEEENNTHIYVHAISLGKYNPETLEWPSFHHDNQRTGLYVKTIRPCLLGCGNCTSDSECCSGHCDNTKCRPEPCYTILHELIQNSWHATCSDSNYNPIADINKDKRIDISDTAQVTLQWCNETRCQELMENTTNPCTSTTSTTRPTISTTSTSTSTTRQTTSTTTPNGCPLNQICCSDMSDCSDPLCLSGTSQGQCSSVYHYYSCNNCGSSTTSTTSTSSTSTTRQTTSTSTSSTITTTTTTSSTTTTTIPTTSTTSTTIPSCLPGCGNCTSDSECCSGHCDNTKCRPEPCYTLLYELIQNSWHATCGDSKYNPVADINKDGRIDISDTAQVTLQWCNETRCQELMENTTNPCTSTTTTISGFFYLLVAFFRRLTGNV
jgi:subtilisin family serine protease